MLKLGQDRVQGSRDAYRQLVVIAREEDLCLIAHQGGVYTLKVPAGTMPRPRSLDSEKWKALLLRDATTAYIGKPGILYALDAESGSVRWYYLMEEELQ